MTNDEADFALLSYTNEKLKFAIPFDAGLAPETQATFERGIDNDWFTFVDFYEINSMPCVPMRIFKLTPAGVARRATLMKGTL